MDFGSEDEETVVVGVSHVGSDGDDSCGSAGAMCIDEVELDADMAFVPVTEGGSDGLLAAEVLAGAGVSVETCVDEMVLDAGIVPVPVTEGTNDSLSPAEAVAVVGVPVRAGNSSFENRWVRVSNSLKTGRSGFQTL